MKKKIIISITIIIVVLALALLSILERAYNMAAYSPLVRWFPVIGAVSLIVGIILLALKKGKYALVFSILLILALVASNQISTSIIKNQRQIVFNDGIRIANALESYNKANNTYPEHLKELVPKYIDAIPKIKTTYAEERDFYYSVEEGGKSYSLRFEKYYFDGRGWLEEV